VYRIFLLMERASSIPTLDLNLPMATTNLRLLQTYPAQEPTTRSIWIALVRSIRSFAITASLRATILPHHREATTSTALASAPNYYCAQASLILMAFALSPTDWALCLLV